MKKKFSQIFVRETFGNVNRVICHNFSGHSANCTKYPKDICVVINRIVHFCISDNIIDDRLRFEDDYLLIGHTIKVFDFQTIPNTAALIRRATNKYEIAIKNDPLFSK